MVKHIILWTLNPELNENEKAKVKEHIKLALEGLVGKINGLKEVKVIINPLKSSNAELMLDSTFENEDALKAYQTHPLHVAVANKYVRPFTASRSCVDYIV